MLGQAQDGLWIPSEEAELFHESKKETLKDLSRAVTESDLQRISLASTWRTDWGKTKQAWAVGTVERRVPGLFKVHNQQKVVITWKWHVRESGESRLQARIPKWMVKIPKIENTEEGDFKKRSYRERERESTRSNPALREKRVFYWVQERIQMPIKISQKESLLDKEEKQRQKKAKTISQDKKKSLEFWKT